MSAELQDDQLFLEIVAALEHLGFVNGWVLYGTDYDNIVWHRDDTPPTRAEIDAAREQLVDQFPWRSA